MCLKENTIQIISLQYITFLYLTSLKRYKATPLFCISAREKRTLDLNKISTQSQLQTYDGSTNL